MPGDYAGLDVMLSQIKEFSKPSALRSLSKALANEAVTQVRLSFRESRDPYGNTWAPLVSRKGKPLLDTGRLRNSISYSDVSDAGFRIGTNVSYAVYHQRGVNATVARKPRKQRFRLDGRPRRAPKSDWLGGLLGESSSTREMVIPQRQFIPEGYLGKIWSKAFADASTIALSRILKRQLKA